MLNSTAFRNSAMKNKITLRVLGLAFKRYWRRIIGTCLCWFLYDFCSYPFGIFSSTIVSQLNPENTIVENIGWGTLMWVETERGTHADKFQQFLLFAWLSRGRPVDGSYRTS